MSINSYILLRIMKKVLNMNKPLPLLRKEFSEIKSRFRARKSTVIKREEIGGVPCLWIIPEGCSTDKVILMLHGGGYCLGLYKIGEDHCCRVAQSLNRTVLALDYSLAPENPFPAAIDEVWKVYKAVSVNRDVVLWGESSGCGLALNLMVKLRERGDNQPKGAIMMTPFLDASFSGESNHTMRDKDPYHVEKPYIVADYYTVGLDKRDPMVSPLFHDVSGLAPIMIHIAEQDTLADDGARLYRKIKKAGGKARSSVWKGMWHSFQMQVGLVPEARKVLTVCRIYIDQLL